LNHSRFAKNSVGSPETETLPAQVIAGRFTSGDFDKLRGGYYTPAALARWMTHWAVRSHAERVLEPSCGDGSFIDAATIRLLELGASQRSAVRQSQAIELAPTEAEKARMRLRANLGLEGNAVVATADFFSWEREGGGEQIFDVVVGNPPFIRYQAFPEPSRTLAMELMVREGLKANKLTNIWVPFVVGAAAQLAQGGRLAMVLPAELLQVGYAAQLRAYLVERFERIDVVACNELFFDRAEQEVVLLLAEGARQQGKLTSKVALTETETVADVTSHSPGEVLARTEPKSVEHHSEKWLKYFLSSREISLMREIRESPTAAMLKDHGSIDVGVVTGKNEFFVVTSDQVEAWGLGDYVIPLVSRAAQLRGATIDRAEWDALSKAGDRVHLIDMARAKGTIPEKVRRYIAAGEAKDFHTGYKCSIRTPWYAVPSIWTPDGFFFRQIYDFPRVVANNAGATSTDTIHRLRTDKPTEVISNLYTHLTGASAEIEGRSYGGGVLELEPTEAERLLMPKTLNLGLPLEEVDRLVRLGRLADVLDQNDRLLLMPMGLSSADCAALKAIWTKMRDRRLGRRRRARHGG
jgi:adenine-specific DNA methylase